MLMRGSTNISLNSFRCPGSSISPLCISAPPHSYAGHTKITTDINPLPPPPCPVKGERRPPQGLRWHSPIPLKPTGNRFRGQARGHLAWCGKPVSGLQRIQDTPAYFNHTHLPVLPPLRPCRGGMTSWPPSPRPTLRSACGATTKNAGGAERTCLPSRTRAWTCRWPWGTGTRSMSITISARPPAIRTRCAATTLR